jgi:hypothetical protein
MNIFRVYKGIRKYGPSYGQPAWFVECGLGVNYSPDLLLRKLVTLGIQEKDLVVFKNGLSEKGIGEAVEAFNYIHCKTEVETSTAYVTPGWFPKVGRWLIYWNPSPTFVIGALRPRQDLILCDTSINSVEDFIKGTDAIRNIDRGVVGSIDLDVAWKYRLRVYPKVEEDVC